MNFQFAHYNYNVKNLETSIQFYEKALGLKEVRRKEAKDGSFILVYLGDGKTGFQLELTWLRDWEKDHFSFGGFHPHLYGQCPAHTQCHALENVRLYGRFSCTLYRADRFYVP